MTCQDLKWKERIEPQMLVCLWFSTNTPRGVAHHAHSHLRATRTERPMRRASHELPPRRTSSARDRRRSQFLLATRVLAFTNLNSSHATLPGSLRPAAVERQRGGG